ncbi:ribonuclease J [Candidatus Saccharibacteria bacterium]|jgi:ribonuclease J|nr:ribonuclease J [Candidatus Saccharibacteria bacterium]
MNKQNRPNRRNDGASNKPALATSQPRPKTTEAARSASRGEAIRAQRRSNDDANRIISQYNLADTRNTQPERRANSINETPKLKIIGLGGMDGGGSKNMIVVEYKDEAVIIDSGNDLGVDLPGINYGIADTVYLDSIKHKLKAYIITHGHLDHIGGLPHIVPKYPAPIYGSKFTIGMVERFFENFGLPMPEGFKLQTVSMNETTHEKLKIGQFFVELIRVTHSIPGSTVVVLDTPVGKLVCTGDYKLDPNPHDHEISDVNRLKEIGKEGVLVLLNECMSSAKPGRTPSESTIEQTFVDLFEQAPGRVFVAVFSSNINRIQMLVNAATAHGRKIAMDGRSMMSTLEVAINLGMIRIPKGTFVPIASVPNMKDTEVVIICTGSQGEPNSALQRMSTGDHKHIKLKEQDTVILSSTPIPESGNDKLIAGMVDELNRKGVHVFRHQTREADGCGPLHVSGHCSMDDYMDMIEFIQPKFLLPIYGAYTAQKYHNKEAIKRGFPKANVRTIDNGEVIELTENSMQSNGEVPVGTVLVDQTGATISNVVVKDRLILSEDGLVVVILTLDKKTGQLMTSPDIISRGFIYMRDNEELMNLFRTELKRAVIQRFKRVDIDRFKAELKDYVTHFLYEQTQRSPIVIPVVNIIGAGGKPVSSNSGNGGNNNNKPSQPEKTPEQVAAEQQDRFAQMRQQLLGHDPRTD